MEPIWKQVVATMQLLANISNNAETFILITPVPPFIDMDLLESEHG